MVVTFAVIYAVFAILTYGYHLAYWQREWPEIAPDYYWDDVWMSAFGGLIWPVSIIVAAQVFRTIKHGFKFK